MEWMLLPYKKYADFKGRSRRKEYWMFTLLMVSVYAVCGILMVVGGAIDGFTYPIAICLALFVLATIVPGIAVQVRRFHDQDRSGWMVLLNLIPYLGGIIVLVFMCLDGTAGPNRFGDDPKGRGVGEVFN